MERITNTPPLYRPILIYYIISTSYFFYCGNNSSISASRDLFLLNHQLLFWLESLIMFLDCIWMVTIGKRSIWISIFVWLGRCVIMKVNVLVFVSFPTISIKDIISLFLFIVESTYMTLTNLINIFFLMGEPRQKPSSRSSLKLNRRGFSFVVHNLHMDHFYHAQYWCIIDEMVMTS